MFAFNFIGKMLSEKSTFRPILKESYQDGIFIYFFSSPQLVQIFKPTEICQDILLYNICNVYTVFLRGISNNIPPKPGHFFRGRIFCDRLKICRGIRGGQRPTTTPGKYSSDRVKRPRTKKCRG